MQISIWKLKTEKIFKTLPPTPSKIQVLQPSVALYPNM